MYFCFDKLRAALAREHLSVAARSWRLDQLAVSLP
jgi:hypothetical protein